MFNRLISRRRARVRLARVALIASIGVIPAALPVLTARATVEVNYTGGCSEVFAVVPPQSCTYISIGGEPENIAYEGTGTVSVSSASCQGNLAASPAGAYVTGVQTPGCAYTVAVTGAGIATAVNGGPTNWAQCEDFGQSLAGCSYDAILTTGHAFGEAVSRQTATVDVTVTDVSTFPVTTVSSCSATGIASVTCEATYTEIQGHAYETDVNDPTLNDDFIAVVAEG